MAEGILSLTVVSLFMTQQWRLCLHPVSQVSLQTERELMTEAQSLEANWHFSRSWRNTVNQWVNILHQYVQLNALLPFLSFLYPFLNINPFCSVPCSSAVVMSRRRFGKGYCWTQKGKVRNHVQFSCGQEVIPTSSLCSGERAVRAGPAQWWRRSHRRKQGGDGDKVIQSSTASQPLCCHP